MELYANDLVLKKDRKTLDFLEIEFAFLARLLRRDGRPSHNTMTTRKKTDNNNNKKRKKKESTKQESHENLSKSDQNNFNSIRKSLTDNVLSNFHFEIVLRRIVTC
ncbi:hypothetical protein OUZ56_022226 [Daphnia magna]|uniref:Uncharacterized protein n=1 Tax=Daphnia magna TaxID=35525 RepID=A0ABR0AVR9_9CRUS|nr:hypothetical protein OUZ56_022226 [Daphnia magna]